MPTSLLAKFDPLPSEAGWLIIAVGLWVLKKFLFGSLRADQRRYMRSRAAATAALTFLLFAILAMFILGIALLTGSDLLGAVGLVLGSLSGVIVAGLASEFAVKPSSDKQRDPRPAIPADARDQRSAGRKVAEGYVDLMQPRPRRPDPPRE